MMNLPKWIIPDKFPALYDLESATAIEMVAKLYGSMQTLINEYNEYVSTLNKNLDTFESELTDANKCFKETMETFVNNFITCVDVKIDKQNAEIASAIDEIIRTAESVTEQAIANGKVLKDATARESIETLNRELTVLENRMNTFTALAEGSTTADAELIDIRNGADGETYATAGEAVRTQFTNVKSDLSSVNDTAPVLAKTLFTRQSLDSSLHVFSDTTNRIAYPHAIKYNNDILIKCESGYKFVVSVWGDATTDATVWVSTTPWLTENYIISANTYFTILIAKADDSTITTDEFDKVKLYRTLDGSDAKELTLKVDELETKIDSIDGNIKNHVSLSSGSWAFVDNGTDGLYAKRIDHATRYATNNAYTFTKDIKISMPNYTHYSVFVGVLTDTETMTTSAKSEWLKESYYVVPANKPFVATVQLNDSEYTINDAVNALSMVAIDSLADITERISVLEENTEIINADLKKNETYASLFNGSGEVEPFLYFTDPHYVSIGENGGCRSGYENHLPIIKKHYDNSSAGFVLCGGDWLNSGNTQTNACYTLSKIKGVMRKLFDKYHLVVGNHDTNYQGTTVSGGGESTGQLTQQTLYNIWYGEYGKSYYSFKGANTKFYIFDCGIDWNHYSSGLNAIDNEQLDFFVEQLRSNDDKHIALVPHMVYISGENLHPLTSRITEIASVYNSRGTIQHNGKTYDFSQKTGKVEFMIAGHTHADLVGTLNSIPYIQTINADVSASYPSFDLVFVDYTARKLKTVRIGTGEDREINLAN